jgi:penicillin-binding protein 1C
VRLRTRQSQRERVALQRSFHAVDGYRGEADVDETANAPAEPVRLSIVSPKPNDHLWRNPEVPASLNRLVLGAVVQPHVTQIVWYVDGEPFAVADHDRLVYWPIAVGAHRFQIRLPFERTGSKPVRIVVE